MQEKKKVEVNKVTDTVTEEIKLAHKERIMLLKDLKKYDLPKLEICVSVFHTTVDGEKCDLVGLSLKWKEGLSKERLMEILSGPDIKDYKTPLHDVERELEIVAKCTWEFVQYSDGSTNLFETGKRMTPEMFADAKKSVERRIKISK